MPGSTRENSAWVYEAAKLKRHASPACAVISNSTPSLVTSPAFASTLNPHGSGHAELHAFPILSIHGRVEAEPTFGELRFHAQLVVPQRVGIGERTGVDRVRSCLTCVGQALIHDAATEAAASLQVQC